MRVIHISPTAFGTSGLFGGGERYPLELAAALSRHVECKLVTFGTRNARYRHDGVDVTELRRSMLLREHPAHPVAWRMVHELASGDLIHAHHLRSFPSRVAALVGRVTGRRRVVTDHGLGPGRWPQIDARMFDRFLTVSRYSAQTLLVPGEKTRVIHGGADVERFHPDSGVERSGVLFVGRLTPHKGVDILIEALPQDARLTIAGTTGHDHTFPESDYPRLLRKLANERDVRFIGRVEDAELAALYRSARVLVLPSVHSTCYGKHVAIPELLGLVLLEAMASGTPVIASRVGGLPEVVIEGETGFVVEPGNVAELRDRLERLIGDDKLLARMGENARRHVLESFTWERCAERCLTAYEELIGAA